MLQSELKKEVELADIQIKKITQFTANELSELCDAAIQTIEDTYSFNMGFQFSYSSNKQKLETYFKGVTIVPERLLFVAKVDGTISGSIQLIKPSPSNQTSSFAATIDNHFVTPWARSLGLGQALLESVELEAKALGFSVLKLSIVATRTSAIELYENLGYKKWGTLEKYERIGGKFLPGFFYCKDL